MRDFLEGVMGSEYSWRNYRTALREANPPCVPYIGVYLQDLLFIEEGNPGKKKKKKVASCSESFHFFLSFFLFFLLSHRVVVGTFTQLFLVDNCLHELMLLHFFFFFLKNRQLRGGTHQLLQTDPCKQCHKRAAAIPTAGNNQ